MAKKFLVVAVTLVGLLLGGCASSGYGGGSGSDSHAGHSH